jgi:hypothetical protein
MADQGIEKALNENFGLDLEYVGRFRPFDCVGTNSNQATATVNKRPAGVAGH